MNITAFILTPTPEIVIMIFTILQMGKPRHSEVKVTQLREVGLQPWQSGPTDHFIYLFIFFFDDFNFFHYSWFTVFVCFLLYSKVTQADIHIYVHTHSFSHIFLHHVPS